MSIFKNHSLTTKENNPVNIWQKEMNSLFDRFNRDLGFSDSEERDFFPKVEVKEKGKHYTVCAEVPGLNEKDINVTLKDNCLIVEGERKSNSEKDEEGYSSSEFSYGCFYRSIPLDEEVNPDTVKASYKDGILKIDLDKVKESQHKVKKISVLKS